MCFFFVRGYFFGAALPMFLVAYVSNILRKSQSAILRFAVFGPFRFRAL